MYASFCRKTLCQHQDIPETILYQYRYDNATQRCFKVGEKGFVFLYSCNLLSVCHGEFYKEKVSHFIPNENVHFLVFMPSSFTDHVERI